MRQILLAVIACLCCLQPRAQQTVFEKSGGKQSASYAETIRFYQQLDQTSDRVKIQSIGMTDAGYPLHLVLVSGDKKFDPKAWHQQGKLVILVINGIHPGEPDGIDASMMLVRDITRGKLLLPANVCLGIIPVYNIGGSLNRNRFSRVNQEGPEEYGFRGNAQNLDLNRDFTKCDSKNARSFAQIFHFLDPDIQIDNHVSDGADYQYTMTMLTTQADKLGGDLGHWLKNKFEPSLFKSMADKSWEMTPYVNFERTDFNKGMEAFYDPPRYSSGYAALWQTIAFVPETHMLKPFKDRTLSTYAFMQSVMEEGSKQAKQLIAHRQHLRSVVTAQKSFPLSWRVDSTQYQLINFKGYETGYKTSAVSGQPAMYFDRAKPINQLLKFHNSFIGDEMVDAPEYYVIPQGWWVVTDLLALNGVKMSRIKRDTMITVHSSFIREYKSTPAPYEKHHKNSAVKVESVVQTIKFLKGDWLVPLHQPANRFIVEMLEPTGADSYFSWNFFDAILQQKEGYSDYRWEEVASKYLSSHPELITQLEEAKKSDSKLAENASAQLNWVYKHSPYYEPGHNRYPVYRIEKDEIPN